MQTLQIFEKVLAAVVPVFLIAGVGFGYAKYKARLNADANPHDSQTGQVNVDSLNIMMLEILSPLLLFTALADKGFDLYAQRWVIIGGLFVVLGSGLAAWIIAKWRGYDMKAFVLPAMFNNCGNMGLPLASFAFGQEGLIAAIALFTACNLLQMTLGIKILSPKANLLEVLKTPLTMGMMLGLISNVSHIHLPQPLFEGLKLLGQAAIPMMLFMLGVRMAQSKLSGFGAGFICAILNPVAGMTAAYCANWILPLTHQEFTYVLLFSSLPPAVINTLMSVRYGADVPQTMSAVVWGHVLSLISVPIAVAIGFASING